MKKNSKVIRKNYNNLDEKYGYDNVLHREYYGIFHKKGILKIDTKRLLKVVPNINESCDFRRSDVYFTPLKKHKYDYCMNYFIDAVEEARKTWYEQKEIYRQIIDDFVKKELSKEAPNYDYDFHCGIIEYDEWQMSNNMAKILHQQKLEANITTKINKLINTLYLETIQQIATRLEHAMIYTMQKMGYEGDKCGRLDIFRFMDGRIGNSESKIRALSNFDIYDKFYSIWNFTKHNSPSTYKKIKNNWSDLLCDKNLSFPSEHLAIEHLNLSHKMINSWFDPLLEFYYEFCELCYGEPKYHSKWNYDDYFLEIVDEIIKDEYELATNPLGLPWWL